MSEQLPVLADKSVETEFGWIFRYNSRKFSQSGNAQDSYIGNAPVFVSKIDGRCAYIGLSLSGESDALDFLYKEFGYR